MFEDRGAIGERDEVAVALEFKLNPTDAKALLEEKLGPEFFLVQSIFGGQDISHKQMCRCLVALAGLQVLRDARLRGVIVANALDDQVRALFEVILQTRETIRRVEDFSLSEMRAEITRRAWHSGSFWARSFCDILALPAVMAGREFESQVKPYELIAPFIELRPLHDFQLELKHLVEEVVFADEAQRCLVALPTGAGKTRLLVDTALELNDVAHGRRNIVWIAQHDELCEQAVQCFAQAWRSTQRPKNRSLTIQRVWKSLNVEIDWDADVIVGIPESLVPRLHAASPSDRKRVAMTVIDEAHHALSPKYQDVFSLLGGSAIVGITATPASSEKSGAHRLRRRFGNRLMISSILGDHPVQVLQEREILSQVDFETVVTDFRVGSEIVEVDAMAHFGDLPPMLLEKLGRSAARNRAILDRLLLLEVGDGPVLCFATSVASARAIAAALVVAGKTAACIDAETEKWNRTDIIAAFRSGKLQFLVNYGVLATGFDAPQVSVLVLSRPTTSPVLFEQMVGRGLRGPANGGTPRCKIIYFKDDFTAVGGIEPLSYQRFLGE